MPSARPRTVLSSAVCAIAAAALLAAPAPAAEPTDPAGGCPVMPVAQTFAPWQDDADYFLAPGGDIEAGAAGWELQGGAQAVEGNEPYYVGAATDHMSLALPSGSAATTPRMCIAEEHRTTRFFANGPAGGRLVVQARFYGRDGALGRVRLGTADGSGRWAASSALAMRINEAAAGFGNALSVSLTFTPRDGENWQIDDVYVDPFRTK